jgi:hypothetical protein
MPDADPTLFELLEEPAPLLPLAEPRMGAVNTKWSQYNGKTHYPCDLCVKRIHERGQGGAPLPETARWKRVGPNDTLWLCNQDAEEMKRLDKKAEDERTARLRLADEARKRHGHGRR